MIRAINKWHFLWLLIASCWLVASNAAVADKKTLAADLVLTNGKIWTVNAAQPECEAVAIWRDRILAVGTSADIGALTGPRTRVIDLKGRRVVPGFYDSHVHLLGSGLRLSQVALKDAKDEAEFARRLQEFHRKLPRDRWLLGGEWDHDRTFAGRLPTAEFLDRYVTDRPVFLRRYDGHMAVVNSGKRPRLAGSRQTGGFGRPIQGHPGRFGTRSHCRHGSGHDRRGGQSSI
jgi:predicted amidohydrolase YtcJ